MQIYERDHLFDTYVFCLSEHDERDGDGLLSMWRGYGAGGKGAALVFDTSQLNVDNNSPLIVAMVDYGSHDETYAWFGKVARTFSTIVAASHIPDDKIRVAALTLFERLKIFALFSKHRGFREEQEWRAVYLRERDPEKHFAPFFSYWNGPRGVEPKLKFKVAPDPRGHVGRPIPRQDRQPNPARPQLVVALGSPLC